MRGFTAAGLFLMLSSLLLTDAARELKAGEFFAAWPLPEGCAYSTVVSKSLGGRSLARIGRHNDDIVIISPQALPAAAA